MKKADLIRDIIRANPEGKTTTLAKMAAKKYGGKVANSEISNYRSALRKAGELNGTPATAPIAPAAPNPVAAGRQTMTVTKTIEVIRELIHQHGKDEVRKLIDVL